MVINKYSFLKIRYVFFYRIPVICISKEKQERSIYLSHLCFLLMSLQRVGIKNTQKRDGKIF